YPWLPRPVLLHYGRLYGTRAHDLIGDANSLTDLGERFGDKLFAAEATYLVRKEWAQTPNDVLLRRTKHGLHLSAAQRQAFSDWFEKTFSGTPTPAAQSATV
ncbi:MAG: glycerol-3-phosphate dehydrogenase C-terminal domain-containing protein, partial [Natronospirillum sp.]